MKSYILFLFSIFCSKLTFCQTISYPINMDSTIIQIKSLYEGYGKIFNQTDNINHFGRLTNFRLSEDEILLVEKIFAEQYNQVQQNDNRTSHNFKPCKRVYQKYKKYYRQYMGYIDINQNRMVMLYLLNFTQKKMANEYFENWKEEPNSGTGYFYSRNVRKFKINISQKKLLIP